MAPEAPHRQAAGHHFLLVTVAAQGQINPTRHLARRLARAASARVTIANPVCSHRRLFPSSSVAAAEPDDDTDEPPLNPDGSGIVSYAPFSDGFDDGIFNFYDRDAGLYVSEITSVGYRSLTALTKALAAAGRPVTCIVYSILLVWAADVARDLGVPSFFHWIQPASVFYFYYLYFHNHPAFANFDATTVKNSSFSVDLPGLPVLRSKDLPGIITEPSAFRTAHHDIFIELDKSTNAKVLVNTFYELEASVIGRIPGIELLTVGPVLDASSAAAAAGRDLFEDADAGGYMDWLEAQEEGSVVYVAFGSLTRLTAKQVTEIAAGLKESGRPYLWVMRKDGRPEGVELPTAEDGNGMVVGWCSQVRVLGHRAVGCFVTHCGWNSTSEALASGKPVVAMPQLIEQATNARLMEEWGIGVRADDGHDGVVVSAELRRSLEVVMGEGERGAEIRRKAREWKKKVEEALADGGSSARNLKAFVDGL
ncbi:Cyanidin 3-O-rutinoside 5-O-glucosyltransferase [Apostasia shenzhenica]|uniref:Glycosyltransferase n=1 Tax=Apostasia shenzhenica TaxID=1088818 RepID=A0A2I0A298_9ASPA|nr:Cyanidin 3-O-rutinoside 5-O-glucosyltransferase [Apostasia shenzhenica]